MLAWLVFLFHPISVSIVLSPVVLLSSLCFTPLLHCPPPPPPPQVDDDDKSDLDDDEIEAINAAGAGGQTAGGDGNATTNGEGTGKDNDAKQTKSVRMNIGGALLVHNVGGWVGWGAAALARVCATTLQDA